MTSIKLVSAGFGGQGVLTLGQMVALMAMKKNLQVSWLPSYGPEMRGGTANCHVVVDEHEVGSPLIADGITHLLALNQPSVEKFIPHCTQDAIIVVHSALTHPIGVLPTQTLISLDFTKLSQDLGNTKVQNMIALGALVAAIPEFTEEDAIAAIDEKFGVKSPQLTELNHKALHLGYASVKK